MKHSYFTLFIAIVFPALILAQTTINGKITDNDGLPLPGATVLEKGTSNGSVTDFDGNYDITVQSTPAILVFSYLGYITREIPATDQTTLNVTLQPDQEQLDEVVIIGYGEVDRKDVTGSITTVKPPQEAVAQSQDIESLLQGRAAGVQVQSGNSPGAPSSIKIRGVNSLTSNTEPLYVIDGVIVDSATEDTLDPLSGGNSYLAPQGGITGINPRDIESMEILKDASATAIYGSRGANGVIIITTKQGKSGKAKFSYNGTTTIGSITNDVDVLDTGQYVAYQNELRANQGFDPRYYVYPDGSFVEFQMDEQFLIDNADNLERLEGVNWSDDTYKASVIQNHRFSVSGGSDTGNYYYALGYLKNEGLIPNTSAESVDFVANIKNELSDKWDMRTKVSAEYADNSASKGTDNLGSTNNNIVRQIISGAPIIGFSENQANEDGTDFDNLLDGPRAWITDYDDLSKELRVLGSVRLDYKISKVFKYRLQTGADYRSKERKIWYGTGIRRGFEANGEAGISTLERFRYNVDNTLMFKKRFNKTHRIDGTIGTVFDSNNDQRTTNQGVDFPNEDLRADGISLAQESQGIDLRRERETIVSFLGRFNYTLLDRYLFTATYRTDGSSKFAQGKRWGHFPAFAFAWKMHEESFLSDSKTINEAKLRLGWGLTGNQRIPNYRFLTPFDNTGSPYSDSEGNPLTAIVPTNLANPDLTWETTSQYNAGIDLSLFQNRVSFTADVYYKEIYDLLLDVQIGPSTGFESYFANQGDLINKGIELSLDADVISNENFTWNVYGNIAFNRNEISDLGIPLAPFGSETYSAFLGRQISGGNFFKVPANIFIEGEAPGLFYGFETDGIINTDAELANAPGYRGTAPQLGDVLLVDQNGDGTVNDLDQKIIGDPNPDFNYGFGTSFSYKRLSLNLFFNGVQGNDIANANLLREGYADNNSNNIRTEAYLNAWRPDNVNGTFPRVGYDLADDTNFTDRLVEDGSFLRLNYITLGYNVPVENIGFLNAMNVSISGQNLLLFTNYSGFDPDVNSYSFDPGRVGIDRNSFPNQKSYSVSLNVTF